MKRALSAFVAAVMLLGLFTVVSYAAEVDYEKLYMDYAKDADENYENPLNGLSGFILLDLNSDNIPELLGFSSSVSSYDKNGEITDRDDAVRKEYTHNVVYAFSIVNGKVVENTPWRKGNTYMALTMPYLPDEYPEMETEEFCCLARSNNGEYRLIMYCVDSVHSNFSTIWYNSVGFGYSRDEFTPAMYDMYTPVKLPVASIMYYNEKLLRKYTSAEAMQIVLDEYAKGNNKKSDTQEPVIVTSEKADAALFKAPSFNDVRKDDKHADYIVGLGYINLIRGDECGNFNPDKTVTRAEFSAMICRILGYEKAAEKYRGKVAFDDVPASHWASGYIYAAAYQGIISGYGDGKFGPEDPVLYEQAVKMIVNSLEYDTVAFAVSQGINSLYGAFLEYPSGYMTVGKELGLTNGAQGGAGLHITRKNVAAMLYNMVNAQLYTRSGMNFIPDRGTLLKNVFGISSKAEFDEIIKNSKDLLLGEEPAGQAQLVINYDALVNAGGVGSVKTSTLGEIVSGMENRSYSVDELSKLLGVRIERTDEIIDELGEMDCRSFEWKEFYVTIISHTEDYGASPETGEQQPFITGENAVMIDTNEIKEVKMNFEEMTVSLNNKDWFSDRLIVRVTASKISYPEIEWSSSNPEVATVTGSDIYVGNIHAHKEGETYIMAKVKDGDKVFVAQSKVTVLK